jgi:hypothetical protein
LGYIWETEQPTIIPVFELTGTTHLNFREIAENFNISCSTGKATTQNPEITFFSNGITQTP